MTPQRLNQLHGRPPRRLFQPSCIIDQMEIDKPTISSATTEQADGFSAWLAWKKRGGRPGDCTIRWIPDDGGSIDS